MNTKININFMYPVNLAEAHLCLILIAVTFLTQFSQFKAFTYSVNAWSQIRPLLYILAT